MNEPHYTDPQIEVPVFASTLDARLKEHFDALFTVLNEKFFAVTDPQDRMEKRLVNVEHRLDSMDSRLNTMDIRLSAIETDVGTLKMDVKGINGRLDRMEQALATIVKLLQK
jgi:hypothetical protein